jgi:hypothetical protein
MDTSVVDDLCFGDMIPIGLQDLGHRMAQKVIPDMPQMQGLVGVGRGKLYHDGRGIPQRGGMAVIFGLQKTL